jgi:hypothetical protein
VSPVKSRWDTSPGRKFNFKAAGHRAAMTSASRLATMSSRRFQHSLQSRPRADRREARDVRAAFAELTSRESPGAGKRRAVTELLLDAQELVVLRESFRLGERADLDLARGGSDGEVREEGILRLS